MGYDLPKDCKVCTVWWEEGEEIGVGGASVGMGGKGGVGRGRVGGVRVG